MTTPKSPEPKPPTVAEQIAERKRQARALYVYGAAKPEPEREPKS